MHKIKHTLLPSIIRAITKTSQLDTDPRLGSMDALNYACAVCDSAKAFATLDERLSDRLEDQYGVRVFKISKKRQGI